MLTVRRPSMNASADFDSTAPPLSAARIADDRFQDLRKENLARWPTGAGVDLDEAVAFHKALPKHKQLAWVMRQAKAEGRCLTQARGGVGTLAGQMELMKALDADGLADIVPTTTDSYTRNERFNAAQEGIDESERLGRSMLNGYPIVNHGVAKTRTLIDAIDKPAIVLAGTAMPRFSAEIAFAAGYSGYLGSAIAYTASYTKETSIADGIRNYQYLDRLAAEYHERGVELHRRHPGFLTGTTIPPGIAITTSILDLLMAAAQGVKNYGLELGQTLHMIQDAAAVRACEELAEEYLARFDHDDVFTSVTSLQWLGAWPGDESQATAMIVNGGILAAVSGAVSTTAKSVHEAFGVPTIQANIDGLKMTRMAIYLARGISVDDLPEFAAEKDLIKREVRSIVDAVIEIGEGDVAVGTVRACEAGILDIPWTPNRCLKSAVLAARDIDGYMRVLDPANMPFPKDVMAIHEEGLRKRAERDGIDFGPQLSVSSVVEVSEPLEALKPFPWADA
jgi:methylaspartate mutase epsilon subunit